MIFSARIAGISPAPSLLNLLLVVCVAQTAMAAGQLPALRRYRDLKVYTTSMPDKNKAERILAHTQFLNEGPTKIRIHARLDPSDPLGFKGSKFEGALEPGEAKVWEWNFTAPQPLEQR